MSMYSHENLKTRVDYFGLVAITIINFIVLVIVCTNYYLCVCKDLLEYFIGRQVNKDVFYF